MILTFGALSLLGATLTLPGIAGIVLGIGLAVDANVLINERIREETRKGLSAIVALDAGFKRAYATIVDSNLTALIATALLFMFGSGPVRGFAVTMGLGIAISMFTAVSIVRVDHDRDREALEAQGAAHRAAVPHEAHPGGHHDPVHARRASPASRFPRCCRSPRSGSSSLPA